MEILSPLFTLLMTLIFLGDGPLAHSSLADGRYAGVLVFVDRDGGTPHPCTFTVGGGKVGEFRTTRGTDTLAITRQDGQWQGRVASSQPFTLPEGLEPVRATAGGFEWKGPLPAGPPTEAEVYQSVPNSSVRRAQSGAITIGPGFVVVHPKDDPVTITLTYWRAADGPAGAAASGAPTTQPAGQ